MLNAIAAQLGLGVDDLASGLLGRVTPGFAAALDVPVTILQSFVDGHVDAYWVDLFNAPIDQIQALRDTLGPQGAAALMFGILVARNQDID
jgi:hypothetical protein